MKTQLLIALALTIAIPAIADHHEMEAAIDEDTATDVEATAGDDMASEADVVIEADSEAPPVAHHGRVSRSTFTTAIENREPVDAINSLENDHVQVFHFTELYNLTGHSVVHRWEFGGKVVAEVPFDVGGPRWRIYSSKNLHPTWLGDWAVSVVDDGGNVLSRSEFAYIPATGSPESTGEESGSEATAPLESPPAAMAPVESAPAEVDDAAGEAADGDAAAAESGVN